MSAEFQHFLVHSLAFYEHLRECFSKWLQTNRLSRLGSSAAPRSSSEAVSGQGSAMDALASNVARCRHSLHRCFIFLGDLARYRELHNQKAKKNFAAAESYYHKALELIPDNGNPHNQLAVLATYVEAETVAVYRYCRSLLIAQPFATAEENLALMFERSRQRPLAAPMGTVLTASSPSKEKSSFLKSFLHRLTRMHGILFSLASRPTSNGNGNNTAGANHFSATSSRGGGTLEYPRDMELLVFKDFDILLRAGVIGDALLLKIVVTNIFCVVRSFKTKSSAADDALRLMVVTTVGVLKFLAEDVAAKNAQPPGSLTKEKLASGLRLLGPVSVFCDFLRFNSEYLSAMAAIYESDDTHDAVTFDNFVSTFLESFTLLVNQPGLSEWYGPLVDSGANQLREQQLQLKENVELQGFSPLESLFSGASKWKDVLNNRGHTGLPEIEAAKVRAWNLHEFGKLLCGSGCKGLPLLYYSEGAFTVNPVVTNVVSTGLPITALQVPSLGAFGMKNHTNGLTHKQQPDEDDDFDDEVIVFQPSPALMGMSGRDVMVHNGLAADKNNALPSFDNMSGAPPFDLRSPGPISGQEGGQNSFGRFSSSSSLGSGFGYPNFNSFGDFSGLSGQGFLSGWGRGSESAATASNSSNSPGAVSTSRLFPLDNGSSMFPMMGDLAAVERQSALYQREESSLSSILAPPSRLSSNSSVGFGTAASAPRVPARPPPGFGGMSPFGSQETDDASGSDDLTNHQPPVAQQFFTRNPFINP